MMIKRLSLAVSAIFFCLPLISSLSQLNAETTPTPSSSVEQNNLLPCDLNNVVDSRGLLIKPGSPRTDVQGDYVTIVYDAKTGNLYWFDYPDPHEVRVLSTVEKEKNVIQITRTANFAPVLYTREKVAVLFCNLRFGASYLAQTSNTPLVEAAVDIRNGPLTNTAAATPVVDSTPADTTSVLSALVPAITVNPVALTFTTTSILSSPSSDAKTYERRTPTVTASQLAQVINGYIRGHDGLKPQLLKYRCAQSPCSINTVTGLQNMAEKIAKEVDDARSSPDFYSNEGLFWDKTRKTQDFIGSYNAFVSNISSASYLSRVMTLSSNYALIRGALQTIEDRISYDNDPSACKKLADSTTKNVQPKGSSSSNSQTNPATQPDVHGDADGCALSEAKALRAYLDSVNELIKVYLPEESSPDDKAVNLLEQNSPQDLSASLADLQLSIDGLHTSVQSLFTAMNDWYEKSSVQDIKILPPLATNTEVQLAIGVHDQHTPFVFGTATPASSTPQSASTIKPVRPTMVIEVHRKAFFNFVGGALGIVLPNNVYSLEPCQQANGSTGSNGQKLRHSIQLSAHDAPAVVSCPYVTESSKIQIQAIAGINWHPKGRDYYPVRSGQAVGTIDARRWSPGVLIATSITSLGSVFGGLDFEPINGLNVYFGMATAKSNTLPPGITMDTQFGSGQTLTTHQAQHGAFAFGVGFDYTVFCQLFTKSCGGTQ